MAFINQTLVSQTIIDTKTVIEWSDNKAFTFFSEAVQVVVSFNTYLFIGHAMGSKLQKVFFSFIYYKCAAAKMLFSAINVLIFLLKIIFNKQYYFLSH